MDDARPRRRPYGDAMSEHENRRALETALGYFDKGFRDPAAAEPYFELYAPGVKLHGFPPGVESVDGLRGLYGQIWAALPGGHSHLEDVIAAGDRVACRIRITGAHTGSDLMGVPAGGTEVEINGQTILRFQDGHCVERWQSMDALGLLQQLGAIPAPA
jgi:predicted ester cyclase